MNLQQLYYFRAIAEMEHYTKASDKLMVTQSSLSHSISDLEQELGIHLFVRQGRNVKLTKYGSLFLEYVVRSLDALEEGKTHLQDFISPEEGTISISYISSLNEFIPFLVAQYFKDTGNIKNKFQFNPSPTVTIEESLANGCADIAFSTAIGNDQFSHHRIGIHKTVVIAHHTHPLAGQDHVRLSQLEGEKFITYNYECQLRYFIDEMFKSAGIYPRIISETTHDSIILASVAANFGVAIIPEPLSPLHSNVKVLPIAGPASERHIYMIVKKNRYISPCVKTFTGFVIRRGDILNDFLDGLPERHPLLCNLA